MFWIVVSSFLLLVALTYVPGIALRQAQVARLRRRSKGRLVLTYDDGPGSTITPSIQQLLGRTGAKATFFLTGFRAEERPAVWHQAIAAGYDVGSHAYWHHDAWRRPFAAIGSAVRGCRQVARQPGASRLFRPPHGRMTTWTYLAARLCGFRHAFWTIDSRDYLDPPGRIQDVLDEVRRNGGGVVLMHDLEIGSASEAQRHRHLLALTEQLISVGRSERWQICTMSELMNEPKGNPAHG